MFHQTSCLGHHAPMVQNLPIAVIHVMDLTLHHWFNHLRIVTYKIYSLLEFILAYRSSCVGGVLVGVSVSISSKLFYTSHSVELLVVGLFLSSSIFVFVAYFPPSASSCYPKYFIASLSALPSNSNLTLLGHLISQVFIFLLCITTNLCNSTGHSFSKSPLTRREYIINCEML